MAEEHKEVLQKYWPMPSEREIRKLYVNGITICIEFFFCFFKSPSVHRMRGRHRRWRSWGLGGYPSTSILASEIWPKSQTCTCLHCLPICIGLLNTLPHTRHFWKRLCTTMTVLTGLRTCWKYLYFLYIPQSFQIFYAALNYLWRGMQMFCQLLNRIRRSAFHKVQYSWQHFYSTCL